MNFYNKADTTTKSNENKKDKIDWQKTYLALQQLRTKRPVEIDQLQFPVDSASLSTPKSK